MSEKPADYFESYDNISVHNLMLRDGPRVAKYREAILKSKNTFKDKIVLDVGSGTGLLSLFCAQAGAKQVYAVEASKGIFELSKAIVASNNLSDKITLINGEIEKITLPVDKVDIIVSEWMGVYLLHESMLNSVLFARDKWLEEDGKMYPSVAYLYVSPVEMSAYLNEQLNYWLSYQELNFEAVARVYRQLLLEKPAVETVHKSQLIDDEKILASFDLKTVKREELASVQAYDLKFVAMRSCELHGFAFWFDVVFTTDDDVVTLGTGPDSESTHWKQTVAFLPNALGRETSTVLNEDDSFGCYVIMNQSEENQRNYVIDIGVSLGKEEPAVESTGLDDDEQKYANSFGVNAQDYDSDEDDDDDYSDGEEHPMPCDCGNIKCVLIKATLEKYDKEAKQSDSNNNTTSIQ